MKIRNLSSTIYSPGLMVPVDSSDLLSAYSVPLSSIWRPNILIMTAQEYAELDPKDPDTLYFIKEASEND